MSVSIEQLQGIPIFSVLPNEALESLSHLFALRSVAAGEILFGEESDATDCFALLSGQVLIQHSSRQPGMPAKILGRVMPGALFGEAALFEGRQRNAEAIVDKAAQLLVIPGESFRTWAARAPHHGVSILSALLVSTLERLHQADQELSLVYGVGLCLSGEDAFGTRLQRAVAFMNEGLVGVTRVSLYQYQPLWSEWSFAASAPSLDNEDQRVAISTQDRLMQEIEKVQGPLLVPLQDDRVPKSFIALAPVGSVTLALMPIRTQGPEGRTLSGVLVFMSKWAADRVDSHQKLLLVAMAIPWAEALARHLQKSETDARARLGQSRQTYSF